MSGTVDHPQRVRMERISRRFGGVQALQEVSFEAAPGEIHAVCGENGAGKSTLVRVLAGIVSPDQGTIRLDGREVRFARPRDAEAAGVRIVHQELSLVPDLSVAANLFLGHEPRNRFGLRDDRTMNRSARAILERLGLSIDVRARAGDLRVGDQQLAEIARALAFDASVLILDEPTSALSEREVDRLFRVARELRSAGTTILFITHRLGEVQALADRITVLRDGRHVATADARSVSRDQLLRWMVGRVIATAPPLPPHPPCGPALLEVEGLSVSAGPGPAPAALLESISFQLHRGEVLGVAGLLGAGRTELLEALFGAGDRPPHGTIRLEGRPRRFRHPAQAARAGLALVAEDRKRLGLFDNLTTARNITIAHLRDLSRAGVVNRHAERQVVKHSIDRLRIRCPDPEEPVLRLSGGNQQKCLLARWLLTTPCVLLLDEPTRGIDVAAKAEIHALIRDLARHERVGVIMTSSELPELLAVCDRILVLCEGRLTATLSRAQATEEIILEAATRFPQNHGGAV